MIRAIIDASLRDRFLVLIATAILLAAGIWSAKNTPLDAIPDLSDVQVIVFTEYPGQAPQVVEDQVTYPLTTAMLAVPNAKVVRGYSFFGYSFVYIIFEDGGVGWIYEYALVDRTGNHDLAQLRSLQDWYLRYPLQTVEGVAEVASVGGYVKQYQVEVDPNALAAYNIPLARVKHAIKRSNNDVGGKLVEMAETEFMVRGRGYIQSVDDLKVIPVGVDEHGTPIRLQDVANIQLGPELRRGVADLNGEGEVAAGVVIMRYGENALATIERVRAKLEELKNIVVSIICILFLLHARSALVAIVTLPIGILMAFIVMRWQGINANIMSRHRHRRHGGRRHRDDRERPQAPGAFGETERSGAHRARALGGGGGGLP